MWIKRDKLIQLPGWHEERHKRNCFRVCFRQPFHFFFFFADFLSVRKGKNILVICWSLALSYSNYPRNNHFLGNVLSCLIWWNSMKSWHGFEVVFKKLVIFVFIELCFLKMHSFQTLENFAVVFVTFFFFNLNKPNK